MWDNGDVRCAACLPASTGRCFVVAVVTPTCLCCCGDSWHTTHLLPQAAMLLGRKARFSKVTGGFYGTAIHKEWKTTTAGTTTTVETTTDNNSTQLTSKEKRPYFPNMDEDYNDQENSRVSCLTQGQTRDEEWKQLVSSTHKSSPQLKISCELEPKILFWKSDSVRTLALFWPRCDLCNCVV